MEIKKNVICIKKKGHLNAKSENLCLSLWKNSPLNNYDVCNVTSNYLDLIHIVCIM